MGIPLGKKEGMDLVESSCTYANDKCDKQLMFSANGRVTQCIQFSRIIQSKET